MTADSDALVTRLRAAGCVFAEEEALILRRHAADDDELARWADRRVAGEPLEHIVGVVEFAGLELSVGPGVFIPRQRTRLIAAVASDEVVDDAGVVFVEPYCGAAPIAAVVARDHPAVVIVATDIDSTALRYAEMNLGLSSTVVQGRGLAGLPVELRGIVAVIAAVPPYVPDDEVELMPGEAREYEPVATHAGGRGGLDEVGLLVEESVGWLRPRGVLLVELHRDQARHAVRLADEAGLIAATVTEHPSYDDDGHTTILVARRPEGVVRDER